MADMITLHVVRFIEDKSTQTKESKEKFAVTLKETSTIRELYQQVSETVKIALNKMALSCGDKTLSSDSNDKLKDCGIAANSTIILEDMMIIVYINYTGRGKTLSMLLKKTTTIKELYQKVCERTNTKLINAWLWSSNVVLPSDSDETLEDYHIGANSNIVFVQRVPGGACRAHYQINNRKIDGSVRLSANKCVLLWVDDDTISKRVEMPCGHAVTPDGLADYIYTEVINQKTKIICPVKSCNAEWKVFEIIKRGLTAKERENLEKGIAKNNLHAQGVQECLQCSAYIQREGNGTRVECLFCKQTGNKYEFCWSCQKRWKNNDSYSNCGNIPCDPDAEFHKILHTCSTKELYGVNVPEVRACPHCNKGINHKEKCKHMECPSCDTKFCFICLSVKSGSKWLCGSYDSGCSVAPRQKMVNY